MEFFAIGEDLSSTDIKVSKRIEIVGRLGIPAYAELASRAALGVSIMVSPHPSYPPLEMAQAGVLVLANQFEDRDPIHVHENIHSIRSLSIVTATAEMDRLRRLVESDPERGWRATQLIDWFFSGQGNLLSIAKMVARELEQAHSNAI